MPSTKLKAPAKRTDSVIDREIRQLLLCTPSIKIIEAKEHLQQLKNMKKGEKYEMKEMLEKEFKRIRDRYTYTRSAMKDRVSKWEEKIGPLGIEDITELLKNSNLTIMTAFPERVTPRFMESWLSQYLFGQKDYARKIALAFYVHNLRTAEDTPILPRTNLLVHGPSGSGKTYGAQKMAEFLGMPFCVINCNSLVQEGIIGNSIGNYFTTMYRKHGNAMEHAVIIFDEFDKLLEKGQFNDRILNELLNIIDDNNSISFNKSDLTGCYEKVTLPTNKMLFIFTGVFRRLEDIIKKRLGTKQIGFEQGAASVLTGDYHQYATEEDFRKLFNRPELSGRIQQYACVRELQTEEMARLLLKSKESPVIGFEKYFQNKDITFSITEEGAMALAVEACRRNLGVRGLKSLMFNILSDDMFLLKRKKIIMDDAYVEKKLA